MRQWKAARTAAVITGLTRSLVLAGSAGPDSPDVHEFQIAELHATHDDRFRRRRCGDGACHGRVGGGSDVRRPPAGRIRSVNRREPPDDAARKPGAK